MKNSRASVRDVMLLHMKAIEQTLETTETRGLTVRAPQLRNFVRVLVRAHEEPGDRRTYIQLELMRNHGLDLCPSCDVALTLEGYARTRTRFSEREAIRCGTCQTDYVLFERCCA